MNETLTTTESNTNFPHLEANKNTKDIREIAIWLFIASLAFYFLISHGFISAQGYDAESFNGAKSLVEEGDLTIPGPQNVILYPRNGALQPILMVPWYLLDKAFGWLVHPVYDKEWIAAGFNPILTALTVLYIFLLSAKLFGRQAGLITALLAAFTSVLVPYSIIGMETFQTLAAIMTFYYAYCFRRDGNRWDLWWAGCSSALLLGAKQISPPLVIPIGLYTLYALHQRWGWRSKKFWLGGLVWLVPVLISMAVVLWFLVVRSSGSNSVLTFSGSFTALVDLRLTGLHSYLFSLNRSIFLYSPILILTLFAFPGFWRLYRAEALMFFGFTVIAFAFPALTISYGDEVWGSRYIQVVIPIWFVVASALFRPEVRWSIWHKITLIGLALFGAFVQFVGSIFWYGRYVQLLQAAGLSNSVNYSETYQTSPFIVNTQLLVSSIAKSVFNVSLYFDYREYYFPIPNPAPNLVENALYPRLYVPKIEMAQFADLQQWIWRVLKSPAANPDVKIYTVTLGLVLVGLLIIGLLKLRRHWQGRYRAEP
jgi:Dolichyl-phosphate-mannose-protein mannosyltransferase